MENVIFTYSFIIFIGILVLGINKEKLTQGRIFFFGLIFGFTLDHLLMDYLGFDWVSNPDNWIGTSSLGYFIVLCILLLCLYVKIRVSNKEVKED